MNYYQLELHKFIIGDIRTDGWISPWRREQEKRRAEEMGRRQFVTAPQIKARQGRTSMSFGPKAARKRNQRVVRTIFCAGCGKGLRKNSKTGKCQPCLRARPKCACGRTIYSCVVGDQCKKCVRDASRKKCAMCDRLLNESNQYGLCKPHYASMRRAIHQEELTVCSETGCDRAVGKHNRYGKCREHSRKLYQMKFKAKLRRAA